MAGREERLPGYLAVIPAEVRYDTVLAPNAKLLYGEITALAGADGYCWASNDYFARLYQMDKRTISRLIGTLQEQGHIRVEVVRKKGGKGPIEVRKIYIGRRVSEARRGIDKNVHTPGQNCREGIDKIVQDYKDELTSNNDTPLPPCANELFDRFWQAYPKKRDKVRARKAWDKLKPDLALCRVMSKALAIQKKSKEWKKDGGEFIPYPATWLNGRRWEDEVSEADAAPAPEGGDEEGIDGI